MMRHEQANPSFQAKVSSHRPGRNEKVPFP